jgi:TonB-dependent receptor
MTLLFFNFNNNILINKKMRILITVVIIAISQLIIAQTGTVRGTVLDKKSAESIIGANVLVNESGVGTVTDLDGKFELELEPGTYKLTLSYIGYQSIVVENVVVAPKKVTVLEDVFLGEDALQLQEVVITAAATRTTEVALLTLKKNSSVMLDGISSAKMKLIGDGNAVDAAKRVTGVSVEGGKYVYVRGLGDRYIKTMMNNVDIPGLDPDKNTLQMDIFPTNLINSIVVSKNFTADLPADFTGGVLNLETKDFPEERVFTISLGTSYNPSMHFNSNFLSYKSSSTDFLGFDDGQRALPKLARNSRIPTPISGASPEQVNSFVKSFDNQLGAVRSNSLMDMSGSISYANQISLGKNKENGGSKLGYMFSLSYKSDYKYYDDVEFGEYQRLIDPNSYEILPATVQNGSIGERNVLVGLLGGVAYKTQNSKIRLTAMHLQNGESKAGKFEIVNDGERVGQSGYFAVSDNLEYNQRSLSNVLLNGVHVLKDKNWEIDWRVSPTLSSSEDPDIRKTAFTISEVATSFSAGAGGNPSRIWRSLSELNATAKIDVTKKYQFKDNEAKVKFGFSQNYKKRDYEILFYDIQFFGQQAWNSSDPTAVLNNENIFPSSTNGIYYQSGNREVNPNEYSSNVMNTAFYVSNELYITKKLKTILGIRAENYVQRHTGRDQRYAAGDFENGKSFDNDKVLDNLDLFPTANFIYNVTADQNLRLGYARTIARPSFKELSFAQILDPITNRIFNGSLFQYDQWDGNLVPTKIDNIDVRWEKFLANGGLFSVSPFYKKFSNPIELVRIPEQQTSTEYQTRNVGDAQLFGVEVEFRKDLGFIGAGFENFEFNANITLVQSELEMTKVEFDARKTYEKTGENITNKRQMAGQSPYVINGGISYGNRDLGINTGIFYNVKGPTLFIVGAGLFPDIYTKPFHSLNFTLNKKLGKGDRAAVDFRVANILGSEIQDYYQSYNATNQTFSLFKPGTSFSLDFTYKL